MIDTLYITTTLPYANSKPHIGHAFEFIIGDALARFARRDLGDENVFFNIGIDEHGLKVWKKAQELNVTPEHYVYTLEGEWLIFCEKFGIDYNNFYKTATADHHKRVQQFWLDCLDRGDIYKKAYSGKYCVGCEAFKLDKELVDGKCPDHSTSELQLIEEENYFFKLTRYKENLLTWITANPSFLAPLTKLDELTNLIEGAEDISISRLKKNLPWGVEVPNDLEQVVYVWFDALLNYIFSCSYGVNKDEFNKWWCNTVQICGPDNLRFQAVIFQSFLASARLNKTTKLLVHGTILDKEGKKMSKTLGNVIDPIEQLNKFGLEAVRYYALAGLSTYSNSQWNENELKELYNSKLSNGYGNLIARTLHLIDTRGADTTTGGSIPFRELIDKQAANVRELWKQYKIREAILLTNEIVDEGNRYFNDSKPWEKENRNFHNELSDIYYLLQLVTDLYYPIIPGKYDEIKSALLSKKKVVLFPRIA